MLLTVLSVNVCVHSYTVDGLWVLHCANNNASTLEWKVRTPHWWCWSENKLLIAFLPLAHGCGTQKFGTLRMPGTDVLNVRQNSNLLHFDRRAGIPNVGIPISLSLASAVHTGEKGVVTASGEWWGD